jgi:hypothetical protein
MVVSEDDRGGRGGRRELVDEANGTREAERACSSSSWGGWGAGAFPAAGNGVCTAGVGAGGAAVGASADAATNFSGSGKCASKCASKSAAKVSSPTRGSSA